MHEEIYKNIRCHNNKENCKSKHATILESSTKTWEVIPTTGQSVFPIHSYNKHAKMQMQKVLNLLHWLLVRRKFKKEGGMEPRNFIFLGTKFWKDSLTGLRFHMKRSLNLHNKWILYILNYKRI